MVILLFNASEKDLNRLKTKDYPIDLTIRSRSNLPPAVSKDGGSFDIPIYSIGMRGKYVFEFDINIGDSSSEFIDLIHVESNYPWMVYLYYVWILDKKYSQIHKLPYHMLNIQIIHILS